MITAIVLVTCDVSRIPEVAQELAALDGVSEVYSVTGDADVIADRVSKVVGVKGTTTHIAFRTYSSHDLEAAFSLGLD